jgi:hypothetical protein
MPDGLLLPGQYVRVRLAQAELPAGMLLPQQAVTRSNQGDTVLVVGADGVPAKRQIKLGASQNNQWIVQDGLQSRRTGHRRRVPEDDGARRAGQAHALEAAGRRPSAAPAPPPHRARGRCHGRTRTRIGTPADNHTTTGARMAQFFINRPIFAWVIALFILVMGGVAITQLPIAQYPPVAPPSIVISAAYPGASARTLEDSVISVIEREMNGSPGLIYMESVSQANGTGSITLSFEAGTNPNLAQVDVQNRLARATPRLPSSVTQQGVRVDKANQLPAVHHPVVRRPEHRPGGAGRLRGAHRAAGDAAPARRRPGPAVRHRTRDAHLGRPGQTGRLQPGHGRRDRAIRSAERPGLGRHHRRPAQHRRPDDLCHRGRQGPARQRRSSSATSCCVPTPTAPPCACATWPASNWAPRVTPRRRA